MTHQLMLSAKKKWRKPDGQNRLPETRRPHSSLDGKTPDQAYSRRAGAGIGGSLNHAEIHLRNARNLFKRTQPPLIGHFHRSRK